MTGVRSNDRLKYPFGYFMTSQNDGFKFLFSFGRDGTIERHAFWYESEQAAIDAMWDDVRARATRDALRGLNQQDAINARLARAGYSFPGATSLEIIEHLLNLLNGRA